MSIAYELETAFINIITDADDDLTVVHAGDGSHDKTQSLVIVHCDNVETLERDALGAPVAFAANVEVSVLGYWPDDDDLSDFWSVYETASAAAGGATISEINDELTNTTCDALTSAQTDGLQADGNYARKAITIRCAMREVAQPTT